MINSDKIEIKSIEIKNAFIQVFINDYVKKFRDFNQDSLEIIVLGLNSFMPETDTNLDSLIYELKKNDFSIKFQGNEKSVTEIDVSFNNITNNDVFNFKYSIQNLPSLVELSSKTDISLVGIITIKIIAQVISKLKTLYKAIVLDLDDTLWKGTLSEDGIDKIIENMNSEHAIPFIEFMKFVKALGAELGIFIAISSRNDHKMVERLIDKLDINIFPLKNQIDYIIANDNDKSENIRIISEQLSILPSSIVFIDDNQIVRDEVKQKLSKVFVPEWGNHNELVIKLIASSIFERSELSINSQNRRKQFKIIKTERIQNSLPKLNVKILNDDDHIQSIKLYSKSNQFKFSLNDDNFNEDAESVYFEIIRENGENLGICSAITFSQSADSFHILNWAMSCRYFELGLEEFILLYVQKIANSNKIFIDFKRTEYNQKVSEMLAKYSNAFSENNNGDSIIISFTKAICDTFNKNTNLSIL